MSAQERFFYFGVSDENKQNQIVAAMTRLEKEGISFALRSAYQEAQKREEKYKAIVEKEETIKKVETKKKDDDDISEEELEKILSEEVD